VSGLNVAVAERSLNQSLGLSLRESACSARMLGSLVESNIGAPSSDRSQDSSSHATSSVGAGRVRHVLVFVGP